MKDYFVGCLLEAASCLYHHSEEENGSVEFTYENVKITLNKDSDFDKIIESILKTEAASGRWLWDVDKAPEGVPLIGMFTGRDDTDVYVNRCEKLGGTWLPEKPYQYSIINKSKCIASSK